MIRRFVKWYLSLRSLYICERCNGAFVERQGELCSMCQFEEE